MSPAERITALEADVAKLQWQVAQLIDLKAKADRLKTENQRWREAGQLMLDHMHTGFTAEYRVIDAINAAKEAKPQP